MSPWFEGAPATKTSPDGSAVVVRVASGSALTSTGMRTACSRNTVTEDGDVKVGAIRDATGLVPVYNGEWGTGSSSSMEKRIAPLATLAAKNSTVIVQVVALVVSVKRAVIPPVVPFKVPPQSLP